MSSWTNRRGSYNKVMQIIEQLYQTEPAPKNEKTPEPEIKNSEKSENEE